VAPGRAADFNTKYAGGKAREYDDAAQMLDEVKPDVVYICLPPFAQTSASGPNVVELAAAAGAHIFIEKPIALDLETAARQIKAINDAGVKSQVGFMFRFGEAVEAVKKLIDNGEAGTPGWGVGTYQCNCLHGPWWRQKDKSGGQSVEQIIHTYDVMRYLIGEPEEVFCFAGNVFHPNVENYTSEDVSATSIRFKNGATVSIAGTNGAIPGKWLSSYSLACKNLTANFADSNNAVIYSHDGENVKETKIVSSRNTAMSETLDLLNAIETGGATRTPIEEGEKTLKLVLAARESGETGQVIKL
jgi:predicted dehydrogenase